MNMTVNLSAAKAARAVQKDILLVDDCEVPDAAPEYIELVRAYNALLEAHRVYQQATKK